MPLFDKEDIEQFTGFASSDFKQAGVSMTVAQWTAFASTVVDTCTQIMQRFCNVPSFESHSVIEYHNGRGATGDGYQYGCVYEERDRTFYLREYSTTVASVAENTTYGAVPTWTDKVAQSATLYGDYVWWSDNDITRVRFHDNVPIQGIRNVRITYTGGYPAGSSELYELKTIGLRLATNLLLYKKKVSESQTIRAMGTKDYAQMFEVQDERKILTQDIARDLCKYRRWDFGGEHLR